MMLQLFSILVVAQACTHSLVTGKNTGEACLVSEIERLEALPDRQDLTTLDGQAIHLDAFFSPSYFIQSACTLPHKFYHWRNEVRETTSRALGKEVTHEIRSYSNLMSTCYPEKTDDGRTYGDVAEFYDEKGAFMGFAVYLGQGLYCSLPYAGYKGP